MKTPNVYEWNNEPRNTQNTQAKASKEDEKEGNSHDAQFVRVSSPRIRDRKHNSNNDPARTTSRGRVHHDFSTTVALNDKVRETGEEEVIDTSGGGENAGKQLADSQSVDEDVGHVVACDVDARYLVHGLHPGAEDHTTEDTGGTYKSVY